VAEPKAVPEATAEHEVIKLCFPAIGDLVVLARFTAATVATRSGFNIDEIEDLRLAVDELCVSLGPIEAYENVKFEFERSADTVGIACALERSQRTEVAQYEPTDSKTSTWERTVELSRQLLDALVDEHGQQDRDGHLYAWMKKRASQ
jgi:hypothetical protein